MRIFKLFLILAFLFVSKSLLAAEAQESPISWQPMSDKIFEQAAKENKLVIMDLEAVWCHWCHVMADTTYQNPKVAELIRSKFIPLRVDQDANPDISIRYEDWGWPATVIFAPNGSEIVKRRGYIPPEAMVSLLEAVIQDPTPGPSVEVENAIKPSEQAFLNSEQVKKLEEEHLSFYDKENGGWGNRLKLIDPNQLEWAIIKARNGDPIEESMARKTLDQALNLLDPVWGGFYQYSDEKNWKSPHYEKIMSVQSSYMKLYALAYAAWKKQKYLDAAEKVAGYVAEFWTDAGGAFYTSQDADVDQEMKGKEFYAKNNADRRALGKMPKIDRHIYSRENGWMISALCSLYDVTGNERYLDSAKRSAEWILKNRNLSGDGFRHDAEDRSGPYLGDTFSMARAFLDLYRSSAERKWLSQAESAMQFIQKNFQDASGAGFITSKIPQDASGVFLKPVRQIDENVVMVRLGNLLFHYTGKEEYKSMAQQAMKYLTSPDIIERNHFLAGILITNQEMGSEPAHVTIVGKKNSAEAKALFAEALQYPSVYKRVEWWDSTEGLLPNPDVKYPELAKPAAFLCADKVCSIPSFTPEKLKKTILRRTTSP